MLSHVRIRPAAGPNWEVYTRILHLENPIIPDHNEEWIPLESIALDFFPDFSDWSGIYKIKIQICSPDARFSHTVQYEITLNEKQSLVDLFSSFVNKGL
jgi:hypothetical protein